MDVKLIVSAGKNAGQALSVAGPKFFIGRSEECQLRPHSDQVSRHHCVILVDEGYVGIRDFGSKNGTFVNGSRVKMEQELRNGDQLQIGPLEFEVQLSVSVGGKKKPKVQSVGEAAARTVQSAKSAPAGAGADDEIDLEDILSEKETVSSVSPSETRVEPEDADGETVEMPAAAAMLDFTTVGQDDKKDKKDEPAKPTTVSSRSAASDAVRQMFKKH